MEKIKCPYCGHEQSIQAEKNAACRVLWVRCKARHCGQVFEIILPENKSNCLK